LKNDYLLCDLIEEMIRQDPIQRLSVHQVNNHIYFWDDLRKLIFLKEFSDYLETLGKFSQLFIKN